MKLFELYNEILDEDYPLTWDIETFKTLKSFKARIQYCQNNLQRISSGSSRIVYKIDNEKVLKLARNEKGLSQNELEATYSNYRDISDILAKVFDSSDDNTWIEMELVTKLTPNIFKQITGFNWSDYIKVINKHYYRVNPELDKYNFGYKEVVPPEIETAMWEEEFTYSILNYIGGYDVPVYDLKKLNSYGVVKRDGVDTIVLIDYGINHENYSEYYK